MDVKLRFLVFGLLAVPLGACGGASKPAVPATDAVAGVDAVADVASVADVAGEVGAASDAAVDAAKDFGPKPSLPEATGCNTAVGWIPKGLTQIQWDDGKPGKSLPGFGGSVAGKKLNDQKLHEAVRFDIDKPVRIWGFSIRWDDALPADGSDLQAGLYPDFGNNGFDFWQFQAYWEGSRCPSDSASDPVPSANGTGWLDYALPEPMTIDQPMLVYVAHLRGGPTAPAFALDTTMAAACTDQQKCCETFANCHSAWNLPKLKTFEINGTGYYNWNGLSSSHATDYLVRLWVEELPEVTAEAKVFAPMNTPLGSDGKAIKPSNRHAFGDFDNDGDDDLFQPGPVLWRNDGGQFVDATATSGLKGAISGGVWGDYDNDGCPDLFTFVENYTDPDLLWKGDCKGGFVDVTKAASISGDQEYNSCKNKGKHAPSAGAGWADLDSDGLLDLYISRFQCWDDYSAYQDTIWHNDGGGKFSDWTGKHGFPDATGLKTPSRGTVPVDADQDGDMDIFVNNYVLVRNLFFRNDSATFQEVGLKTGLAGIPTVSGASTYYGHSIGAAFGDLDGDGDLDAVVANLAHPRFFSFSNKSQVLIQDTPGHWADNQGSWEQPAGAAGLRFQETHSVPALGDFDQNGTLDLAISAVYEGRPTDFYWGNGDGTFTIDRLHAGISSRGGWHLGTADIDNDGDLDFIAQGELLRNQLPKAAKGHFLQVRTVGDGKTNRMGLGATVTVTAAGKSQVRFVCGGTGQGGQNSATVHFGLGAATQIDSIQVRWIGGGTKAYAGPFAADQRLWLYESGKVTPGWAPKQL